MEFRKSDFEPVSSWLSYQLVSQAWPLADEKIRSRIVKQTWLQVWFQIDQQVQTQVRNELTVDQIDDE